MLFARFQAEGARHICLSASRRTGNEHVPVFRDVFAGRKPVYKLPVEFPAGCVFDVNDSGVCLVKTGIRNKAFNAVALAITVLLLMLQKGAMVVKRPSKSERLQNLLSDHLCLLNQWNSGRQSIELTH